MHYIFFVVSPKGEWMNLLSVNEAGKVKGTTRQTVYNAIKTGMIDAERVGSYYVVKDNAKFGKWAPNPNMQKGGKARWKEGNGKGKKVKRKV